MEMKLRELSSVYPKMLFKQVIAMSIETMLVDGRILAVEYKGEHLYDGEGDKRRIGAVWADASGGKCLFCMPTERVFQIIDQTI